MSKNTQANLNTDSPESSRSLKLRSRLKPLAPNSSTCEDAPMADEIKQDVVYETSPNFHKPMETWLPMMHSTKQEAHEAAIKAKSLYVKRKSFKAYAIKKIAA